MVKRRPPGRAALSDLHGFWARTGTLYARGQGGESLADPFIGLGVMPAGSALFRDLTGIRFQHPEWIPANCTGCGNCFTVCPDTAIPGLVNDVTEVLDTVVARVRRAGHPVRHLPRAVRAVEQKLRPRLAEAGEGTAVAPLLEGCLRETLAETPEADGARAALAEELDRFREALGGADFALTRPYFTRPEKEAPGTGGLFSITINPYTCKGCSECIAVCDDDALRAVPQTAQSVARLRRDWDLWLDLPTTPARYRRTRA